jgi:hypothetical protein
MLFYLPGIGCPELIKSVISFKLKRGTWSKELILKVNLEAGKNIFLAPSPLVAGCWSLLPLDSVFCLDLTTLKSIGVRK